MYLILEHHFKLPCGKVIIKDHVGVARIPKKKRCILPLDGHQDYVLVFWGSTPHVSL
jgi:hypothetical protein